MRRLASLSLVSLAVMVWLTIDADPAWARARGFGARGSSAYSTAPRPPARVAPAAPSNPTRLDAGGRRVAAPAAGLGGFVVGGLLGRMLFGAGGTGAGVGPVELLLVAGGLYLVVSFFRHPKATTPGPAHALADASAAVPIASPSAPARGAVPSPPLVRPGPRREAIQTLDRASLADAARALFVVVQSGLALRDMGMVRNRLTPEMHASLQAECDRLRAARQSPHIETIDVAQAEVEDAWRELGQEFATVRLRGTLFAYAVDDTTGTVLEGSGSEARGFEEHWAFTRQAGAKPWRLAALQTG